VRRVDGVDTFRCIHRSLRSHQHPINIGRSGTVLVPADQILTADGSCAAHWEYTVAVIEDEPRILALYAAGVGL
jgi:methionine aminopeptidase